MGSESLGLLCWDDGTALDDGGHDSTDSLNTKRKRSNINQEDVLGLFSGLSSEDSSLYSGSISHSLIRVDSSVGFFSIEEVLHHLLNFRNTGRATNKYDFVDFALFHTGIVEHDLDGIESFLEKIGAKFFETSTSDSFLEIDAVNQTFDGDFGLDD